MMMTEHKCWRIPLLGRGAYGSTNGSGHFYLLGIRVQWLTGENGWAGGWAVSFFGLIALCYTDTRGGTVKHCRKAGFRVETFTLSRPVYRRPDASTY